jgi:hypothetical protein
MIAEARERSKNMPSCGALERAGFVVMKRPAFLLSRFFPRTGEVSLHILAQRCGPDLSRDPTSLMTMSASRQLRRTTLRFA